MTCQRYWKGKRFPCLLVKCFDIKINQDVVLLNLPVKAQGIVDKGPWFSLRHLSICRPLIILMFGPAPAPRPSRRCPWCWRGRGAARGGTAAGCCVGVDTSINSPQIGIGISSQTNAKVFWWGYGTQPGFLLTGATLRPRCNAPSPPSLIT